MKKNDVSWTDEGQDTFGIRLGDPDIVGRLVYAEGALVAGCSVQVIVDSFGDGKELRVTTHDQPMHVKSCVERIPHEHLEHFGYAPAFGRRTDIPDCPPLELSPGQCRGSDEISITTFPDERLQVGQGATRHDDFMNKEFLKRRIPERQVHILPDDSSSTTEWSGNELRFVE